MPSGDPTTKAFQIINNFQRVPVPMESFSTWSQSIGLDKNLKVDMDGRFAGSSIQLSRRMHTESFGWHDERAKRRQERYAMVGMTFAPRALYGAVTASVAYDDPEKLPTALAYTPALRRVRLLSSTDLQDTGSTADGIQLDNTGGFQVPSKTVYPYTARVVAERKYLTLSWQGDGSYYFASGSFELKNVQMERRPIYIIETKVLDEHFVYSKRVLYVEQEYFRFLALISYDKRAACIMPISPTWCTTRKQPRPPAPWA